MKVVILAVAMMLATSCASNQEKTSAKNPREHQIAAYLWQQTSGEYRALTYQAYNLARLQIERELEDKHNRKRAVVFDIDETLLDNSYGGAREIQEGLSWKENHFADWVKLKQAVAIPGALDFVKFLKERNVEVIYLSNRRTNMFQDTYDNLVAQGFPVKKENLMLMGEDHSKEARRLDVSKKYTIVMLVGDNLSDFHVDFEKKSVNERNAAVDRMRTDFGQKYIILPNPLYGDWERALPQVKDRLELLKVTP